MKQTLQLVAVSAATTVIMGGLLLSIASVFAAPTQAPPGGNPTFPLQGATGPAGSTGPAGPAGPTGPAGPAGTTIAPSLTVHLNDFNQGTASWRCQDVNLTDICGDGDGCRVRLIMMDKVGNLDETRTIEEHIAVEQISGASSQLSGASGWTVDTYGGNYSFVTGNSGYANTVFDPWGIAFMFTYRHSNCYTPSSVRPAYNFSLMSHPSWYSIFHFYD